MIFEILKDDEEKQREIGELFNLDYDINNDNEFILNTPGIKILQV